MTEPDRTRGIAEMAAVAFVATLAACVGGLLTYWWTGLFNPERGSGTGETLFLSLSPALVICLLLWVVLRRTPTVSAAARLAVLALGWLLFVVTVI